MESLALHPSVGISFVPTSHSDVYPSISPPSHPQPSKTVLITGAGRGIGRAIALSYAQASVSCIILCSRTLSELSEVESAIKKVNEEIKVLVLELDVKDEQQVAAVLERVRTDQGRLDVLVNNAGTSEEWKKLAEGDPMVYWRTWEINVKGPYLMMHFALPLMVETAKRENTTVDIVNVGSIGGNMVLPTASGYQSTKLALARLTQFVAAEYAAEGVNTVVVHPGGVKTELASKTPSHLLQCEFFFFTFGGSFYFVFPFIWKLDFRCWRGAPF